jgi:hypothetical protein
MEIVVKVTQAELNDMGFDGYELKDEIYERLDHKSPDLSGFKVTVDVID